MPESTAYNTNLNPNINTNHNPNPSSAKSWHIEPSDQSAAKKTYDGYQSEWSPCWTNSAQQSTTIPESPAYNPNPNLIANTNTNHNPNPSSAKSGHIEPSDQSAAKNTDDGYQGEWCPCWTNSAQQSTTIPESPAYNPNPNPNPNTNTNPNPNPSSAKSGHIEPSDQSAAKKTYDGYQGEWCSCWINSAHQSTTMPESPAYNPNPNLNPNTNTSANPNTNPSSAKSWHIEPSDQLAAKKTYDGYQSEWSPCWTNSAQQSITIPESPAYNPNPNPIANINTNHNPNPSSAKSGHIEPSDQSAAKNTDDGYQGEWCPCWTNSAQQSTTMPESPAYNPNPNPNPNTNPSSAKSWHI